MTDGPDLDRDRLEHATRLGWRGHGRAEPNPHVGCVVADAAGRVIAEGSTAACGGAHAEANALRHAGTRASGGTMWVTLEPCNHHGRTPPCVDAVIASGIARVVIGVRDPNPIAAGGIERLRDAGIEVVVRDDVPGPHRLHHGFLVRIATGRPSLLAKWAETQDGDLVAPPGRGATISNRRSHALVHRERGRVDAILTGIGTVIADDPRLDARIRRPRRRACRVILDRRLQCPPSATLLEAEGPPVLIAAERSALDRAADRRRALEAKGAILLPMAGPSEPTATDRGAAATTLHALLETLGRDHAVSTILTEAGPGLLRDLFLADLVDAALVFTAPIRFDERTTTHRPRRFLEGGDHERAWSGDRDGDRVEWWLRRRPVS